MGKQVLIIGRSHHPDGKETADDIYKGLLNAEPLKGYEITLVHYKDILFDISSDSIEIKDTKSGHSLDSFDSVLMTNWFSHASIRKDIAFSLGLYWQQRNIPFFNTEALHSRSSSKLSQMLIAAQNGVPIPQTIFSLSFDALSQHVQSKFGLPCIFKDAQGSRGQGNHFISSGEELAALKDNHTESHPYIAQNFIDSDKTDYRFFVAGGKTRLIIKRMGSEESHLTNTSAGASTQVLQPEDLGAEVLAIVHKSSELLHREVTGIDIMFDKTSKKPYFLEANPIPQIATGSNVELKLNALAAALAQAAMSRK